MAMSYGSAFFRWQVQTEETGWLNITDSIEYDDSGNGLKQVDFFIGNYLYRLYLRYSYEGAFPNITTWVDINPSENIPSSTLGAICLIPQPKISTSDTGNRSFALRVVCQYYETEASSSATELITPSIFIDFCGYDAESIFSILEDQGNIINSLDCNRTFIAEFTATQPEFANTIYQYGIFVSKADGSITYFDNTNEWLTSLDLSRSNTTATLTASINFCYIMQNYVAALDNGDEDFWKTSSFGCYVVASRDNIDNTNYQYFKTNPETMILGNEPISFTQDLTGATNITVPPGTLELSFNYAPRINSNFALEHSDDGGVNWSITPVANISNTSTGITLYIENITGLWNNRTFRVTASNPRYSQISNTLTITVADENLYVVYTDSGFNVTGPYFNFELRRYN